MCSITGSFSKEILAALVQLNAYRGQHSHSVYVFERFSNRVLYSHRGLGELNLEEHNLPEGYIVVHQQAPTTENKDESAIHPAQINENLLWHNGIVKADEIKRLQEELESTISWDTKLILLKLMLYSSVKDIDGTFSCLWYDGTNLFLFRNEISPMFIDADGNISSTKFPGSEPIDPNLLWIFTPSYPTLVEYIEEFNTVENPYFFADERT